MNRGLLIVVGFLVLVGVVIAITSGPSLTDRIAQADSCSEILAVLPDVRDAGSESVNGTYQDRVRELDCG